MAVRPCPACAGTGKGLTTSRTSPAKCLQDAVDGVPVYTLEQKCPVCEGLQVVEWDVPKHVPPQRVRFAREALPKEIERFLEEKEAETDVAARFDPKDIRLE